MISSFNKTFWNSNTKQSAYKGLLFRVETIHWVSLPNATLKTFTWNSENKFSKIFWFLYLIKPFAIQIQNSLQIYTLCSGNYTLSFLAKCSIKNFSVEQWKKIYENKFLKMCWFLHLIKPFEIQIQNKQLTKVYYSELIIVS